MSDLPSHESHLNHNLAQPIHPYRCVTLHQCLYVLCLHRRKLLPTRALYRANEFPKTGNRALRWCTYRRFINCMYGVLGTRVRRVIRYCATRAIQEIFPLEALGEHLKGSTGMRSSFHWISPGRSAENLPVGVMPSAPGLPGVGVVAPPARQPKPQWPFSTLPNEIKRYTLWLRSKKASCSLL